MHVLLIHCCGSGGSCSLCWLFYGPFSALHMDVGIVVGMIKSQGWFWTEVSVSMIGWLAVIDGAWPMDRPPKSIPTDGKDEMAVGTLAAKDKSTPPFSFKWLHAI